MGRWAKAAGITLLLFLVFIIGYAAVHAAIAFGMSTFNHAGNAVAPPRVKTDYEGRFFTYNSRLVAAFFSPGLAIGAAKLLGKRIRNEDYRVPLMVLIVLFGVGGALLYKPIEPHVWQDTALALLEAAMIVVAGLTLMPSAMAVAILRPVVVPLVNIIIRERK